MKTDTELKLALAKLLPEKIVVVSATDEGGYFRWKSAAANPHVNFIEETEWLHICWLIEQTFGESYMDYIQHLVKLVLPIQGAYYKALNASWQQRAEAILKVKGIE